MRARRVDQNQMQIVRALQKVGCIVADTSKAGEGFPDLVVGRNGENYLMEVKDGSKPPSARKLTKAQEKFHAEWRGQIAVVETVEQALQVVL